MSSPLFFLPYPVYSFIYPCPFLLQLFPAHPNSVNIHQECMIDWWHEHSFIKRSGCKLVLSFCTTKKAACLRNHCYLQFCHILPISSSPQIPAPLSQLVPPLRPASPPFLLQYITFLMCKDRRIVALIFPQAVKLFSCITNMTSPVGATSEQRGVTSVSPSDEMGRAPSPF